MATIRDLLIQIRARDRGVRRAVDRVNRQLDKLDKHLDRIGQVARRGGLAVLAASAIALAPALASATGGVAGLTLALTAAIAQAAGLAVALPAAAAAGIAAMATLKLALTGVGDTLGKAVEGDMKKFEEGLASLSASARTFTRQLGLALLGLRTNVQEAFFRPLVAESRGLGALLRGPVQQGMAGVAASMGRVGARVVQVAREARSIAFLRAVFAAVARAVDNASAGVAPLLRGFRALASAFLGVIPKMGTGVAHLAAATGRWMQQIVRTGQAARWFTGALTTLRLLGSIIGNVGTTLGGVFGAASASGGNLLVTIDRITARMAAWATSSGGRAALLDFFVKGRAAAGQLWRIATNLGTALGGIFGAASGQAGSLLDTIEQLTAKFAAWTQSAEGRQQLTQTFALLGQVARDLLTILPGVAMVIGTLARWFNSLPGPVRDVVSQFLAWSIFLGLVAGRIAPLVRGISMLAGGLVRVGSAAGTAGAALGRAAVAAGRWAGRMAAAAGRAVAAAARVAASFAKTAARMIASTVTAAAKVIAQWVLMAAKAVIQAAIMAAAWLAANPVALVIALIVGLVVVIIKNWDTIKEKTVAAFNAVWGFIKKIAGFIKDIFFKVHPVGIIIKHWDTIKEKTVAAFNAVWGFIKKVARGIVDVFLRYHPVGIIISHWNQIKDGAISRARSLLSWLTGLPRRIVGAVGRLGGLLYGAGRDVLIGLWNGIVSMANRIRGWIMDLVRNIIPGPVRRVLGIHSPSKVMAGFGRNIGEGLALGIASTERMVGRAALGLANAALPQVGTVGAVGAVGMAAPPGLARTGAARGEAALTARAIGDAVAEGIRRSGLKVDMDGRQVAEIVSRHTGRATDQRRRTG